MDYIGYYYRLYGLSRGILPVQTIARMAFICWAEVALENAELSSKLFLIAHDRASFLSAPKIQKLMENGGLSWAQGSQVFQALNTCL